MGNWIVQLTVALIVSLASIYIAIDRRWSTNGHFATDRNMSNGTHQWGPTVLLISIDGLKPEYLSSGHLPNLLQISQGTWPKELQNPIGVLSSKAMIPVSPSLTFPNHWTLQTGLQPSSHGIVANDFHTQSNESFYYTDPSRSWDAEWWKGTPVWEQLETLNVTTANLMWPGPPRTSNNVTSTYFQRYEKGWSLDKRLDKMVSWLDKNYDDRPRFLCGEPSQGTPNLSPSVVLILFLFKAMFQM